MEVSVRDIPEGAQLIDVREADEYAEVHALGAVNIPMSEFTVCLDEVDTEQDVYVICKSGGRSARVVEYLTARDIKAINVAEGTDGWVGAGLPTE
ncbi:rhodanese-like domain-containing protein [Corynebacterium pseudotuberculosis]|uniref:Rhodanese-like domain-containing protein n=1 Tax=Corynebacterium pseudotuberculosis 258 TaxID=1168865 RepID=A0AAU8PQ57_CORPS|nr:rhodanese-like domain-containing protein [Corynebacterium pseudotuberculosis]AER69807.1 Rhodanese-related sulfurtransferase [Corynebacterium pseudotuberculosis 1/06-A]AEQ07330.1 rhodanese-like domain-containing protein [Corynebacterium pseudotuberculosis CIP 52.97]AFB73146.1 rhodanese-like domain-containing protein [Corynebacterium pseudotuberculosis 316]AFH91593.1 rhodanese-like domain-containing protein [Corynebacterium pseudotuberculosis 31]AFK17437.1 rhodanese-like domain-containing pro